MVKPFFTSVIGSHPALPEDPLVRCGPASRSSCSLLGTVTMATGCGLEVTKLLRAWGVGMANVNLGLTSDLSVSFSLCIFCGERSESFTEEGLDLHYWKHCLMLTRCEHCRQVRHRALVFSEESCGENH